MRAVTRPGASPGFTLLEALVVVVIIGILLAVGLPKMQRVILAGKVISAGEMYAEGVRLARQQALSHNASTRLVLSTNATNGQKDWQVDLCFPQNAVACTKKTGSWSTATAPAAGDPEGASGYMSVARSANGLPKSDVLIPSTLPVAGTTVYFNSLGWVDTTITSNLTRITLTPATGYAADVRPVALVISLAGTVIKCDPSLTTTTTTVKDSRICP